MSDQTILTIERVAVISTDHLTPSERRAIRVCALPGTILGTLMGDSAGDENAGAITAVYDSAEALPPGVSSYRWTIEKAAHAAGCTMIMWSGSTPRQAGFPVLTDEV